MDNLTFSLKDVFSQYLWSQADFPNSHNREHRMPDGVFMVNVLYSLSRSVGVNHPVVATLANDLHAQLMDELHQVELELTASAERFNEELNADILQMPDQFQPRGYEVEREKLRKLPIKFIRCFVLFDSAMHALTQKSRRGMITKSTYLRERRNLARSLRRFMEQNNTVVREFHKKRHELMAEAAPGGSSAAVPVDPKEVAPAPSGMDDSQ